MSLIIEKKKVLVRLGSPVIGQQKIQTVSSTSITFTFVSTPAAGSKLCFYIGAASISSALTATPTGWVSLFQNSSNSPSISVGYVIADGVTNSFTFTYGSSTFLMCVGWEVYGVSSVTYAGSNFATGTSGIICDAGIGFTNQEQNTLKLAGFGPAGGSMSGITWNNGYGNQLDSSRGGGSSRLSNTLVTSQDATVNWTTNRQVQSAVIKCALL